MNTSKILNHLVFLFFSFLIIPSCTHDPVYIELLDTVCFESQVLPLIQASCGISGCHTSINRKAGFDATNYGSIMEIVNAGSPKKSELYKVITSVNREIFMPPSPYMPLNKEQRSIIEVWISQGALNTACPSDTLPENPPAGNDTTPAIQIDSVTFVQDILPIFVSGCAISGCHDATTQREGYVLNNYSNITSNPGSIVPFNPSASKLLEVMTDDDLEDRMPPLPRDPLNSAQIALIQQWISEGALNSDYPDITCDTANITFSGTVKAVLQSRCLSCHSNSVAAFSGGNIKLADYIDVKIRADNGSLPGAIKHLNGFSQMPKGSAKLDDCSIRKIEIWIEEGIQDN